MKKIKAEQGDGNGFLTDPRQMMMNFLSLCIFPFAARPVITEIMYNGDEEAYIAAMKQRRVILPEMYRQFMNQNP